MAPDYICSMMSSHKSQSVVSTFISIGSGNGFALYRQQTITIQPVINILDMLAANVIATIVT